MKLLLIELLPINLLSIESTEQIVTVPCTTLAITIEQLAIKGYVSYNMVACSA